MLDWEVNLINRPNRQQILLANIEEYDAMVASAYVGSVKVKAVDVDLRRITSNDDLPEPCFHHVPHAADEIASVLGKISPLLDNEKIYTLLAERSKLGRFQASVSSTNVLTNEYLLVDDDCSIKTCTCGDDMSDGSDQIINDLF